MENNFDFPTNPFEDVKPSDFNKLNKKNVTEDFVEENFKLLKWKVFKPFSDTGVDRIIFKNVCPNNHTPLNENLNANCKICDCRPIEITRFLQVKTRQLKNNVFGYTLKSKDIRVDPRHVFLLYSDGTTLSKQDFLILPNKIYLSFFKKNNLGGFSNTSFRKGNNKLNSLKYDSYKDVWKWGKYSWEEVRNKSGLALLQNPDIDLNLGTELIKMRNLIDSLLRNFSRGVSFSKEIEHIINKELQNKLDMYTNGSVITSLRKSTKELLEKKCDAPTFASMNKYYEFIKLTEVTGESEENDTDNE